MPRTFLWIVGSLTVLVGSTASAAEPTPVDFRTDVIAALSRAGCNQGRVTARLRGRTASG